MQERSSLARLQQATTLATIAGGLAWLAWFWGDRPVVALTGCLFIVFFYALVLALEFIALRFFGGADPAGRPTPGELLGAWLGETVDAARVFCWRQPFRWREEPDHLTAPADGEPRRGVVFIHGFVCNRGFWTPWMKALRARGHCFAAVNLEPVFGSIDSYAPLIEDAVDKVTRATGLPPVLVCHSMGGLAARAWLRAGAAGGRIHHLVTIGTPHHGTWLAQFSHLSNGRQMRRGGEWLRDLPLPQASCTCWYANCDNIVFPVSTATLPGADNRLVRGVAHVSLGFRPEVLDHTLAVLARPPKG